MVVCSCTLYQRGRGNKKSINRSKIPLQLDYTTSSGCGVSNRKWLSKIINLWLSGTTVSSYIFIAGIGQRTT